MRFFPAWVYKVAYFHRITSRKYYNFTNDAQRKGDTIKPFTREQSWLLLMRLLGDDMVKMDREGSIKGTEEKAARALLDGLGGVSLEFEFFMPILNANNFRSLHLLLNKQWV